MLLRWSVKSRLPTRLSHRSTSPSTSQRSTTTSATSGSDSPRTKTEVTQSTTPTPNASRPRTATERMMKSTSGWLSPSTRSIAPQARAPQDTAPWLATCRVPTTMSTDAPSLSTPSPALLGATAMPALAAR
ncbi:hypothetical protein B0T16DRAFT_419816 [Cercophora newfieldiana]|uniref:Uncharacterized protein n=1 Tax=Cercophora newfieldiana TaxID=92897 RepID=A0AA39XXY9_9PEZI|nr:hypothetical protein B0T16DRAFT_419816 [Cercophora newfieldiana]